MIFKCMGRDRRDDEGTPICTYQSEVRWSGRCPGCGQTYECRAFGTQRSGKKFASAADSNDPKHEIKRIETGQDAFDRLLGGGLVASQAILLAGKPGTRKTSFMLQVLDSLAKKTTRPVLYASAEQNVNDVMMFCRVVGATSENLKIMGNVSHVDDFLNQCSEMKPVAAVMDSLQSLAQNSGANVDKIAHFFVDYCKRTKMVGVAINHMTNQLDIKGGTGPAHDVDTVLIFEPYIPDLDGSLTGNFGKAALQELEIDYDAQDEKSPVENLRVLTTYLKNRYGSIGDKVYLYTTRSGEIVELKKRKLVTARG